jgi:hypothetical protein
MASALTINKTRIYLNNNPLCHQTVVDHIATNDHFVRIGDTSGSYSNVSFTNKAVISIEDNLVTSVSHKRKLAFELKTAVQSL